ncbi:MAG: adenylate cyclase [Myxococcota bacterium]
MRDARAPSNDIATLTFMGLVAAESVRIARDYTRSFNVIEQLSGDLAETNRAIMRFVPRAFLDVLGRHSIVEVTRGDHNHRELEVLFFDIRSFTPPIESMGPEDGFAFLNAFWETLEPEVRRHRGFVNHFLGDAILALFHGGADETVRCTLALVAALERFNAAQSFAARPIQVGMGVHSGPLMMGIIGSHDRLDPNVVGPPPG